MRMWVWSGSAPVTRPGRLCLAGREPDIRTGCTGPGARRYPSSFGKRVWCGFFTDRRRGPNTLSMEGERGWTPPASQSVSATGNAYVAGRDINIFQEPAAGVPFADRDALSRLLRAATVRIDGGANGGTGYFVAPGIVATCARVITRGSDGSLPPVLHGWIAAEGKDMVLETVPGWFFPGEDNAGIAFLRALGCDDVRPVLTAPTAVPGDLMWVFGHPPGEFRDGHSVSVTYQGLSRTSGPGNTLLGRIAGPGLGQDLAGAPVLNFRTGAVCGMVCLPAQGDSAYLMSVASLLERGPLADGGPGSLAEPADWLSVLPDEQIRAGGWLYPGPQLRAYLEAAVRAAQVHPWVIPEITPPPLTSVYVHQKAKASEGSRLRARLLPDPVCQTRMRHTVHMRLL
jgi:hypothetical protein